MRCVNRFGSLCVAVTPPLGLIGPRERSRARGFTGHSGLGLSEQAPERELAGGKP